MSEIKFRFSSSYQGVNQGVFSNLFHLIDWTFMVFLISISAKNSYFGIFFAKNFAHILKIKAAGLSKFMIRGNANDPALENDILKSVQI